ncbi:hypothetical protein [Buttiauxella noackiae]|uniref:hypothetical protein n=1 Tax=Buttiauxella noackiae TaxID=82992 RepID=UPI0028D6E8D3|nr:hypothetical protein [Buttiauxella noackiae]
MKDILRKSPIERLCVSVSITPQEMALALAGLNPSMRISDVPPEHSDYVELTRRSIARALKVYMDKKIATDEACNALDILLAAFPFIEETTPEIITQKVREAIDDLRGTKGWEDKARSLGGLHLVNYIKDTNRSGRGQHRKQDEEAGTMKMMGVLIHLLVKKSGESSYINSGRPNVTAIYRDVEELLKLENISNKGISRAAFADKASQALSAIHDLD